MPVKFQGPKPAYMAADSVSGYARGVCVEAPTTTVRDIMRERVNLKSAGRQTLICYIKTLAEHIKALEAAK